MKKLKSALVYIMLAIFFTPAIRAVAQASNTYAGPVAVVVAITIPPGLTREKIEAFFHQVTPSYQKLPGLKQKYFTVNETRAGGIYLFTDRAAATAFFTEAWRAQVAKMYGSNPEVTYFDAPVIILGPAGMQQAAP